MAKGKEELCDERLRHAEYYSMQPLYDELYAKGQQGETFTDLMPLILKRENILLAYRNIKTNTGSNTAGTDELTISNIGCLTPDGIVSKVRQLIGKNIEDYNPRPVRRKDIPKTYDPNKTRPLSIPCIWDRLVQQCIKQVLEPICEARFSNNSYGFRPNRSVENAIAAIYKQIQVSKLRYVIEFDIKGFFDNVDHTKLMRQIWTLGIHDVHLIHILQRTVTAPIKLENGEIEIPKKGTQQGGIISPLLANIVLNELDHWVENEWQNHPVIKNYKAGKDRNGASINSHAYRAMRKTKLKEMYIIRYADDFRIFCRTEDAAQRTKIAITKWLKERLKLDISPEKTRIVNVKRHYMNFLGFKIKVHPKGKGKLIVKSHVADKNLKYKGKNLAEQARRIARPRQKYGEAGETRLYNEMVEGMQNFYQIATEVTHDLAKLQRNISIVLHNRLKTHKGNRLVKSGRELSQHEKERYGQSRQLRYVAGTDEPIYTVGFVRSKNPMNKKRSICPYTTEGRKEIHANLKIDVALMHKLMRQPSYNQSAEYADNKISLYSAQWGKCAVTGQEFTSTEEIHCHHQIPRQKGGTDKYDNLVLVTEEIHRLIHATRQETIEKYLCELKLKKSQLAKLNKYRAKAGLQEIVRNTKQPVQMINSY
jgi:group II intron reverse transcriptase/maturase